MQSTLRALYDPSRRNYILRVLLTGSIILSLIAVGIQVLVPVFTGKQASASSSHATFIALAFFIFLYILMARGAVIVASYLFCGIYFILGTFLIFTWGTQLPQGVMLFALAIITSSLLIGSRAGTFFTVLTSLTYVEITWLHHHHYTFPDLSWSQKMGSLSDVVVYVFSFAVLMATAWLSNREIARSFGRAHEAERQLTEERNQLEVTVEERTRELRERQEAEIQQLYQFAYFGRVTSSLLHDLVNPVSTLSLSLRRLKSGEQSDIVIQRAVDNTKRIERFIEGARDQLRHQDKPLDFSLTEELGRAVTSLNEEFQAKRIQMTMLAEEDYTGRADPVKFHRLATNLLKNAVDALSHKSGKREILTQLTRKGRSYRLSVQDNGEGISQENIKKVFDPFFTTKNASKGMGIGLSICKEIVEHDLHGTITIHSNIGEGTTVYVDFPAAAQKK